VTAPRFVGGVRPEGYLEVDAARLLLILDQFALPRDPASPPPCEPEFPYARHFPSEYHLQKLDFLLRYPRYFAYELIDLHAKGEGPAADRSVAVSTIRQALGDREPDLYTEPFLKFMRGAYERIDNVEAWWYTRRLVYTEFELRQSAAPWKHYFVTDEGLALAERLKKNVGHAAWYAARITQIHLFMGHLRATEIKARQYRHPEYSQAQYNELIPDLPDEMISGYFVEVFDEELGVPLGEEP
jgi:hypothetical protein